MGRLPGQGLILRPRSIPQRSARCAVNPVAPDCPGGAKWRGMSQRFRHPADDEHDCVDESDYDDFYALRRPDNHEQPTFSSKPRDPASGLWAGGRRGGGCLADDGRGERNHGRLARQGRTARDPEDARRSPRPR